MLLRTFVILLSLCLIGCHQEPGKAPETLRESVSGRQLFIGYCAPCHSRHSLNVMGPGFEKVKREGRVDLLYSFLQNEKTIETDTAFISLTLGKQYHVINFPSLTLEGLQSMMDSLE